AEVPEACVRIVSVGEILWDVIGENEYLGGAPLNFAAHARHLGHEVFLLSAVGKDDRGRRALEHLRERGISTEFVQELPGKNTGIAEVDLLWHALPHVGPNAGFDPEAACGDALCPAVL